jgi:hypothetical protein
MSSSILISAADARERSERFQSDWLQRELQHWNKAIEEAISTGQHSASIQYHSGRFLDELVNELSKAGYIVDCAGKGHITVSF